MYMYYILEYKDTGHDSPSVTYTENKDTSPTQHQTGQDTPLVTYANRQGTTPCHIYRPYMAVHPSHIQAGHGTAPFTYTDTGRHILWHTMTLFLITYTGRT